MSSLSDLGNIAPVVAVPVGGDVGIQMSAGQLSNPFTKAFATASVFGGSEEASQVHAKGSTPLEATETTIQSLESSLKQKQSQLQQAVVAQEYQTAAALKNDITEIEELIVRTKATLISRRREVLLSKGFPKASDVATIAIKTRCSRMDHEYKSTGLESHIEVALLQLGVFIQYAASVGMNYIAFNTEYEEPQQQNTFKVRCEKAQPQQKPKFWFQVLFETNVVYQFAFGGEKHAKHNYSINCSQSGFSKFDAPNILLENPVDPLVCSSLFSLSTFEIDDSVLDSLEIAFSVKKNAIDYLRHLLLSYGFCVGCSAISNKNWPVLLSLYGNTRNLTDRKTFEGGHHLYAYQSNRTLKPLNSPVPQFFDLPRVHWLCIDNAQGFVPRTQLFSVEPSKPSSEPVVDSCVSKGTGFDAPQQSESCSVKGDA